MKKEELFYTALEEIFVGAKIEGDSGYVNLLKIKQTYFQKVFETFKNEVMIDTFLVGEFKEEMFEKMYNFFHTYFNESGSVYYAKEINRNLLYEKIYANQKDIILFWKTHTLYYVKSDLLFKNTTITLPTIEDEKTSIYFNVSNLKGKQNNEKKTIIYIFENIHNGKDGNVIQIGVMYSANGKKTNFIDLEMNTGLSKESIELAINTFEKQISVDYFINKNAKDFLVEQLDLFLYQLMLRDVNVFDQKRLNELKKIREYSNYIIEYISQFEDELVHVWNKPKFALESRYVISLKTLKNLISKDDYSEMIMILVKEIKNSIEYRNDISNVISSNYHNPLSNKYVASVDFENESIHLKYIQKFKDQVSFDNYKEKHQAISTFQGSIFDKGKTIDIQYAVYIESSNLISILNINDVGYIDTSYFDKKFEFKLLSMISKNNNVDETLNGYIVKSDNYQFLNSVNKFNNNVSLVYIDPPFNTEGQYAFLDGFKDSTWLSMMSDRIKLIKNKFLSSEFGDFYIHLDHHCNYLGRILIDDIFERSANREIIWNTSPSISGLKTQALNFIRQHDTILFYNSNKSKFNKLYRDYKNKTPSELGWLDVYMEDDKRLFVYKYPKNKGDLDKVYLTDFEVNPIGDIWNDVYSMMYSQNMTRENWNISNTQKPENLVRRIIQASSNQGDLVMDIYAGTGTTAAAAHKLNRKWICVDMGDFVYSTILLRMKTVLSGDYRTKLSEDLNWEGGGFFKYYTLEQYEDTLRNMHYSESDSNVFDSDRIYSTYQFYSDKKYVDSIKVTDTDIVVDLEMLYPNIDFPETISNLLGLRIKSINEEGFILTDGENDFGYKNDIRKMSMKEKLELLRILKPLIWWGKL
jgi:hypothetical protein